MSLEAAPYIHQLNPSNPSGSDKLKEGDDHIRLIKSALKATFPGITGPLDPSITPAYLLGLAGQLVPVGLMAPFYGSDEDIPDGWAICNGQTVPKSDGTGTIVTPDCRGRAIMGLPISGSVGDKTGATSKTVSTDAAGAHAHGISGAPGGTITGTVGSTALTSENIPAHTHFVAASGDSDTSVSSTTAVAQQKTSGGDSGYRLVQGSGDASLGKSSSVGGGTPHGHTLTLSDIPAHSHEIGPVAGHGHNVTVDVTQPSIAFHIIIKI